MEVIDHICAQIHETNDYDRIELLPFNRDIQKTKKLEKSMKEYGFLTSHPLSVFYNKKTKTYMLKEGHHRFYVAKKLNIPYKYVVEEERIKITIYELEGATVPWKIQDYLTSNCRDNKKQYNFVEKYCEDTGIPLSVAIPLVAGLPLRDVKASQQFKEGNFQVAKDQKFANTVKHMVLYLKSLGIENACKGKFVVAISQVLMLDEFDASRFKKKAKTQIHKFQNRSTIEQYLDLFEDIYNFGSRNKLHLKILTMDASKKRQPAVFNKEYKDNTTMEEEPSVSSSCTFPWSEDDYGKCSQQVAQS